MKYLVLFFVIVISVNQGWSQEKPTYASSTFSVPVADLDKATLWYKELLGDLESFSPAPGVVELQLNPVTWLQLFEGELSNGAILRLEVDDIKSIHKKVKAMGVLPKEIDTVPNVVSYFDFKDPDGNQLSFYKLEME